MYETILAALVASDGNCLDNDKERALVAKRVEIALQSRPFSHRLTDAHTLISYMRTSGKLPAAFSNAEAGDLLERLDGICDELEAEDR